MFPRGTSYLEYRAFLDPLVELNFRTGFQKNRCICISIQLCCNSCSVHSLSAGNIEIAFISFSALAHNVRRFCCHIVIFLFIESACISFACLLLLLRFFVGCAFYLVCLQSFARFVRLHICSGWFSLPFIWIFVCLVRIFCCCFCSMSE